ncbi:hypothetical protein N5F23_00450 [Pseudomonas sichuanensis]|uniref:hypothetical protein n=1 Tax=Pseudomonas sichuanensis TaxID=2213015 RepID=UPI002447BC8E|nr:hypothetical protein [Pseudomonas sichuanensis]MDH0730961.1 hypothetical protein [Pseudomonas sichuanensis]MDH1581062.1 hypothetical protein [Pseudomonas sichuanensis]MDH1591077.1 hypothetical protein [Pseudomonas sichuanensis]MDH1596746.1 hypothetical protein [Pseudomonas sichuanensis]
MDITSIPPTVFIAFGVITAALLAGFFSIMNMVSAKENKVSEFRLAWIDGLRTEIAEYTSAAQGIYRASADNKFVGSTFHSEKEKHEIARERYKETRDAYTKAVESLTKIQLRLNPEHASKNPDSPEAKLLIAVSNARKITKKSFTEILRDGEKIKAAAAPLLKSTWDSVKHGEPGYRRIRVASLTIVTLGVCAVITFAMYVGIQSYKASAARQSKSNAEISSTKEKAPLVRDTPHINSEMNNILPPQAEAS